MTDFDAGVLKRVAATVRELAETPEVAAFGLGVAHRPVAEARVAGADVVVDVFRTEDGSEATAVLAALLSEFHAHERHRHLASEEDDEAEAGTHHVYVALWAAPDLPEP